MSRNEKPLPFRPYTCKHCGSIVLKFDGRRRIMLTSRQREIYEFIRKNQPCTPRQIAEHVYAADENGGPVTAMNLISKYVMEINKEIAKVWLKIAPSYHGKGYRIVPIPVPVHSQARYYKEVEAK